MLKWNIWNWTDYLNKNGFTLNNLEWLKWYKIQPTNQRELFPKEQNWCRNGTGVHT